MNAMKRIIAVLLCLLLSVGMLSVVASADSVFGTATEGTLTIYKYKEGTGATVDATGHTPLSGVTFTVYKVLDKAGLEAYLAGNNTLQATSYYTTNNTTKPKYTTTLADTAKVGQDTTGADGKVSFNLPLGVYLVVESDYPAEVTSPMVPFLVSIPMTDPTTETDWMYHVTVYPKNSTSTGNVTIVKKGEGASEYLDATFDLYKLEASEWVKKETITVAASDGANGEKITGLTHGDYKLVEQSTAKDYIVDQTPITFKVDQNNGNKVTYTSTRPNAVADTTDATENLTITVTNEKPTVDKELTSANATPGVGGTVSFKVTVDVPTNIADMAAYVVKDAPVNLDVQLDTVKIGGNAVNTSLYTLAEDGDGFTLTFKVDDNAANFSAIAGESIVITYDALVLPGAATAGKTENTVTLTYNDGVSGDAVATDTVSGMAYYNIDITKRLDNSNTGMPAEGIEFLLTKKNTSGTYEPVTATLSAGKYTYSTAATGTTLVTTLVTTADGKLVVNGLPEGEYKLKETKTKDGYNLLDKEIEITLDASNAKFEQTVVNKAGFTLPKTGGLGTLLFILIGGVLMTGGILLVMPKKKRAN